MIARARSLVARRPSLAAGLLFVLLAILLLNRALVPPDGLLLGGYDLRGIYFILVGAARDGLAAGRLPLWNPYIFNGYPLMADPQVGLFYPLTWPAFLLPVNVAFSLYLLFHVVGAALGMFWFVRQLGGRWLPAVLAGLSFAFGGVLGGRLWAGHLIVLAVWSWTPWILAAMTWAVRRQGAAAAILAGVPVGLAILAGHIPSFLYAALIWLGYTLFLALRGDRRRVFLVFAAMVVVGAGLAAVQLLPFAQLSLASQRLASADYQFATDYSFPPAHLATLLVPEFFGEPSRAGYWSVPTFEELAYYPGMLALLGMILALRRPRPVAWFLITIAAIGLLLAFGRYGFLYRLMYDLLPPFRLMRAPARAVFLFYFAASTLLGLGLTWWREQPEAIRRSSLPAIMRPVLLVGAALGVVALAATGAVFMAVHPTDTSGRLWHQLGGYALALLMSVGGGALLWRYLAGEANHRRPRPVLAAALIAVAVTDLWLFSAKFVRLEPSDPDLPWADAQAIIGNGAGRVLPWGLPVFAQNGAIPAKLPSVFGYVPLEPAAVTELAASVPDPRSTAYDVLGVEFVLATTPLDSYTSGDRPLVLVGQQGSAWVYRRDRVLPVARLVNRYEVITEPAAAVARVHAADFDPAATAILDRDPACLSGTAAGSVGTAEIVAWEAGLWHLRTQSDGPAILIVAENAYPGWEVEVDGEPADALTAYTTSRAVCVPAGAHEVVWRFAPRHYLVGAVITMVALLTVAAAVTRRVRGPRL